MQEEKQIDLIVLEDKMIIDKSIKKIPQNGFYAALALTGGQAYTEDVAKILKNRLGYDVRHTADVRSMLEILPGVEWRKNCKGRKSCWNLDSSYFERAIYSQEIDKLMRKAKKYDQKGLEDSGSIKKLERKAFSWYNK